MWLELYKFACSSHCEGICFWFFYIAFDFTMRYNSFAFSTLYVSHTMLNYALAIFSPLHVACTLQNRSYQFFVAYGLRFWNFPFVVLTVHVACTMHRILLLLFVHYMLITVCDNPFPIFLHWMQLTCIRKTFLHKFCSIHKACTPSQKYGYAYQGGIKANVHTIKVSYHYSALMRLCSHILSKWEMYYKIRLTLHMCKPIIRAQYTAIYSLEILPFWSKFW